MAEHKYKLTEDEKVTQVMVYTTTSMYWGDVITKKSIRVGGWLRTDSAPLILELKNAQTLILGAGKPISLSYQQIFFPLDAVSAFHVMPGQKEDLYYDPSEKNRVMLPVTVFIGLFRFNGHFRISTMTTAGNVLELAKEPFLTLFDIEISHPSLPSGGVISVPFTVVKRTEALWGINTTE